MTREGPLWLVLLAVGVGAVFGAWLRWWLGYWLNARFEVLPMGTLAANLGGAFVIGAVLAYLAVHPDIGPFWRLLLVTGFLGGLTTFSTFSAESLGDGARRTVGPRVAAFGRPRRRFAGRCGSGHGERALAELTARSFRSTRTQSKVIDQTSSSAFSVPARATTLKRRDSR